MIHALLDTNVVIDALLERPPWSSDAKQDFQDLQDLQDEESSVGERKSLILFIV